MKTKNEIVIDILNEISKFKTDHFAEKTFTYDVLSELHVKLDVKFLNKPEKEVTHSSFTAKEILGKAISIQDERAKERGLEMERSMPKIIAIFNAISGMNMTESDGLKFMIALKMGRAESGKFNIDDYVDGASYMSMLGEVEGKKNV